MAVLYGNDTLSVSRFSATPVFWKRLLFFRKSVSKLKHWKSSQFPPTVTQEHADLSSVGLFWKSLVPFFRRTYALSAGFKTKLLRKAFSSVKTKANSNFALKLAERSNHSFLLSIWWITFFKHLYSYYMIMECIELNWLCKHLKKVQPSSHSCTELRKTVFPCEYR